MEEEKAIQIIENVGIILSHKYDDALEQMGKIADRYVLTDTFKIYHAKLRENTRLRQRYDLASFSEYLEAASVTRSVDALYNDADAWRGMSRGVLSGFVAWMIKQGFSMGTINVRISTIHKYCELAKDAEVISEEAYDLILLVKGHRGKEARNIDKSRKDEGLKTRRLHSKKAQPTHVETGQALKMKHTTSRHNRKNLSDADALMMGLFIEHALRLGELVLLDVTSINLKTNKITIYREKTDDTDIQKLQKHTRLAAEKYLKGRVSGSLFLGLQGNRISRRAVQHRVRAIGDIVGIDHLSPHDLRHYWTYDAFMNGTPIDKVVFGGGWKKPDMAIRYAKRSGDSNEGVKITEE